MKGGVQGSWPMLETNLHLQSPHIVAANLVDLGVLLDGETDSVLETSTARYALAKIVTNSIFHRGK